MMRAVSSLVLISAPPAPPPSFLPFASEPHGLPRGAGEGGKGSESHCKADVRQRTPGVGVP